LPASEDLDPALERVLAENRAAESV
jgi:hypothetical protein